MSGTWPVVLDGESFTEADFAPYAYKDSFPRAMAAMARAMGKAQAAAATATAIQQGSFGEGDCLRNGDFSIWSRNTSFSPGTGFTWLADGWFHFCDGSPGTTTVQRITLDVGGLDPAVASVGIRNALQINVAGSPSGMTFRLLGQRVPNVARFNGGNFVPSWWAWRGGSSFSIQPQVEQRFGTGGSPTANRVITSPAIVVPTSPTRMWPTTAMVAPSTAGTTVGTDGNDNLVFYWLLPLNAAFGPLNIAGAMLQPGAAPTLFEPRPPVVQRLRVEEHYQQIAIPQSRGYGVTSTPISIPLILPTTMRATPTAAILSGLTGTNCGSISLVATGPNTARIDATVTATGNWTIAAGVGEFNAEVTA